MNDMANPAPGTVELNLNVNGEPVSVRTGPFRRLSDVLREDCGQTGVKVGCNAGDCGACTVLLDGIQVCSCMTAAAQADDRHVVTVEGLISKHGFLSRLQSAFLRHGAAQCGICMPGMLMAAAEVVGRRERPGRREIEDAMGGVLCRCTGYQKIVEAVLDEIEVREPVTAGTGAAVGARIARTDGLDKLTGAAQFGADAIPEDALWLRLVRSPHAHADFTLGDLAAWQAAHQGLVEVLTAADVPGLNGFGIYPDIKDQPVLADGTARYRGEAVAAVVGERDAVRALDLETFPVTWRERRPLTDLEEAMRPEAPAVQAGRTDNLLIDGGVRRGTADSALEDCAHVAEGRWRTGYVEHAYIEPEAGWARRVGDRVEITVTTQTPYMDRDEVANVMGLDPAQIRITPTACGGGFGGKLDQSVQPVLAIAAWRQARPVACVYERPESMAASTKRHPSLIRASLGCDAEGRLQALRFTADFNTGAYASWGPTVAGRVPVHASGPYRLPHVDARGRAWFTNGPPAGAFRGFGVPQAAIAHETLMDDLADACGLDRLEIRRRNALAAGDATATGQVLKASAGLPACLDALAPHWQALAAERDRLNADASDGRRHGIGIGCMWYGIGNTGMSNPSHMRLTLDREGRLTLFNGAVDIGQGSYTVMAQIAADALGLPVEMIDQVTGDTDLTFDAGKTSASRQTYVSGRAAHDAALALRQALLRLANAGEGASLALEGAGLMIRDGAAVHEIDLMRLPADEAGVVAEGEGIFDPPASPLDADGQGDPYATYGFAAQIALVGVDPALGLTRVERIVAAHDVGRAINPTLVEGQIHGGIAQGLGLALMEEYLPGETEDLHNYLIPTFGDMPEMQVLLIEDEEPTGPFGAKGVGEPGLVPTAPAILGAVRDAVGVRPTQVPLTPDRLRALIRAKAGDER